jgi:hypothetical protein
VQNEPNFGRPAEDVLRTTFFLKPNGLHEAGFLVRQNRSSHEMELRTAGEKGIRNTFNPAGKCYASEPDSGTQETVRCRASRSGE